MQYGHDRHDHHDHHDHLFSQETSARVEKANINRNIYFFIIIKFKSYYR